MEQNIAPVYKGFLLTAHAEDMGGKFILRFFGQSEEGPFEIVLTQEKPLFFVDRDAQLNKLGINFERRAVGLKSFAGSAVDACYFQSQNDLYKVKDDGGVRTYEADVRTTERFLMERFIKGSVEFSGEYQMERGLRLFKNPQMRKASSPVKVSLSTMSFDIETSRGNDLYSIGIHYKESGREVRRVHMVGENQGALSDEDQGELFYYPDERSCYLAFERDVEELDPDLILGWHVVGFDLAFLDRKCQRWGISLNLGRKRSKVFITERQGGTQYARLHGRVVVDGPPAFKAAFYQFDSWKLDFVANEILGTGKDIEESGLAKVEEIERRFREDKVSLAKYNLLDCVLVTDVMEKTGLISLMQTRVELSGLLMDRQGVSTAAFDFFMLPQIHRKGFVAPNVLDISRDVHAAGGHVITPESGLHHHVVVLDFKSLYPSIIKTFKIDPYSRLMSENDPLQTPAGIKFSRTHHILPEFIDSLMKRRQLAKDEGDPYLSQAIKILMNSFYGVMGSAGSRFYHADLPTAITGTGQWILRETIEYFQNDGYEVVYGDTDSVFVKLPSGERVFDKAEKLAIRATEHLEKTLKKHFNVESELEVEFEKYFRKIFFPILRTGEGGAKKKYAGILTNKHGESQLHFSGMEFVRSDWTKLSKKFQYSLYEKFFDEVDLEESIRMVVAELKKGEHDQDLIYKKRLSKKLSEYTKSLPPHVRAAKMAEEAGFKVDRDVFYVYTRMGPMPIEMNPCDYDYQHYIDKQIRPIAEVLLEPLGLSFDNIITGDQLTLF